MAITLRLVKGAPLTHAELDDNFTTLEDVVTALEVAVAALEAAVTALEAAVATPDGDFDGAEVHDYTAPHTTGVSGPLNQATHGGRTIKITGTVSVPVTDGFAVVLRNNSGTTRTINPASGSIVSSGALVSSIALPHLRTVVVQGDGTNVWAGAIV